MELAAVATHQGLVWRAYKEQAGDRIGDLAAGVYFVRLRAGTFAKTAKLVLAE